eukprot:2940608-Pyramimonas_sp.AAC.1
MSTPVHSVAASGSGRAAILVERILLLCGGPVEFCSRPPAENPQQRLVAHPAHAARDDRVAMAGSTALCKRIFILLVHGA